MSPDAAFRIQYNITNGRLYFSYLPQSETLWTVAGNDEDESNDDSSDGGMEDANVESDDDDEEGLMDVEDEEEDLRQVKRTKLK
jgi:basic membrane lipoprotein Med (substrate-binding protein (PBP1-ABC) superfamily)